MLIWRGHLEIYLFPSLFTLFISDIYWTLTTTHGNMAAATCDGKCKLFAICLLRLGILGIQHLLNYFRVTIKEKEQILVGSESG
jgi:hypothetical protein